MTLRISFHSTLYPSGCTVSYAVCTVTLQAGDVVKVPASPLKLVPYSLFWVITNVVRIGAGLSLGA